VKSASGREAFILLCALVAWVTAASADAPCNLGYRDTTPAERARITAALQEAKVALPAPPQGWQLRGDEVFSIPESLCQDYEKLPWDYGFARHYGRVDDYEAREKLMADASAAALAVQAKNQARLDALQAQMMAIMQQQMALNQKGDYDGAQKLQPQMEKTQADYDKLASEGSEQLEAAGREYTRDLEMNIAVRFNADSERPGAGAVELPLPPGALAAVRWPGANSGVANDSALFLFGYWKSREPGTWLSGTRAGVPNSAPHAISVYVEADPERLATLVQGIDFAKLAAIVR
jgi:hypothetical protein